MYDNTPPNRNMGQNGLSVMVSTSQLGARLGLQENGLRILVDLDQGLREKVYASGFL